MWPFTKKEDRRKEPEPMPPIAIGERFKYLGVEMVCVRHCVFHFPFKVIVANYADNSGQIRQVEFTPVDWPSLEAEIAR